MLARERGARIAPFGKLPQALPLLLDVAVIAIANDQHFDRVTVDRLDDATFADVESPLTARCSSHLLAVMRFGVGQKT